MINAMQQHLLLEHVEPVGLVSFFFQRRIDALHVLRLVLSQQLVEPWMPQISKERFSFPRRLLFLVQILKVLLRINSLCMLAVVPSHTLPFVPLAAV